MSGKINPMRYYWDVEIITWVTSFSKMSRLMAYLDPDSVSDSDREDYWRVIIRDKTNDKGEEIVVFQQGVHIEIKPECGEVRQNPTECINKEFAEFLVNQHNQLLDILGGELED